MNTLDCEQPSIPSISPKKKISPMWNGLEIMSFLPHQTRKMQRDKSKWSNHHMVVVK